MYLPVFWVLMVWLQCCVGYVIIQPPAQYYDYQIQPAYQWEAAEYQPYSYQPSYYDSYYYNYPSTYASPEYYNSYPDQTGNYNSYYYYYPSAFGYPSSHKSYSRKPDLKHCPSYNEGQKLLQVYRLIRVIEIFRTPHSKEKKMTSLDWLVQRLTEQTLQDQLVELVCHVDGYEEVAALDRGPPGIKLDMFVDDIARLLRAIQRALNALDLDSYGGYHHGCCEPHKELCKELRHLRDQANALTVAQIKSEMVEHIKAKVKEAFDTDILEDLDEDLESRLLELDNMDLDLSAMEKAQVYNVQGSPWEALMSAPELTLEQHTIIKVHPTQEKHEEETVKYPPHEYIVSSTTNTPVTVSKAPATAEDIKASLLGSLGEKLNSLPSVHHAAGIKHPVTHAKPVVEESTKLYVPIVVKKPDDVVHHFDEPTSVENANFISTWAHSVPLWLTKDPESQKGHYKDVVDNPAHEAEQIAVNEAALQVEQVEDPLASYNMLANLIDELQKSTPSPIFDGQQTHHHHHQNAMVNTATIPNKDTSSSSLNVHKVNADHAPSELPKGSPSIHPVHAEESHHSRNDDLISTLQNIIGEQMISNENLGKEENKVPLLPGTEFITGTTSSTTVQPTVTVAVRNSWLGSLLGNGYLLTTEDTSQPVELVEAVTEEDHHKGDRVVLAVEDIVDANSAHDPESTDNRTSAVAAVYQSVASWLRKNPEQRTLEDEEIVKDTTEDVEETPREHPINEPKSQLIQEDPVLNTVTPTILISVEELDKLDSVSLTEHKVGNEQDTPDREFSTKPTTSSISFNDSEEHTEHAPVISREGELAIPVETAEVIAVDETTLQPTNEEVVELLTADELEQASLIATANQNISTNSSNVHKATTESASSVSSEDQTAGLAGDADNGQHSRSDELAMAVEQNKGEKAISVGNPGTTSFVSATTEAAKGSWLGSLLGKGYLLPIRQSAEEVSHPTELMETPEPESTSTSSLNNSEEHTEHASVEFREGELSIPDETVEEILEGTLQQEDEDVVGLITVDKVEEAPVPGQKMSTNSSMIHEMTTERSSPESFREQTTGSTEEDQHSKNDELTTHLNFSTGAGAISEENLGREEHIAQLPFVSTTTEAARESWLGSLFGKGYLLPIGQTTNEVSQPPGLVEAVTDEDNKRGNPSVEEVVNAEPAESTSNRTSAVSAVYNSVASWLKKSPEQQKIAAEDQAEVDDEKARELSVDEPAADEQPILTNATFDSDVRGFIRNEIAKVLTSLEETNGFTDLKEHIRDQDVDHLVQSLSDVRTGVRWTEMISGLQKLVTEKQLDNGERIVEALAQWKKSEDEQLDDDGYFERVYGVGNDTEGRGLDVEENIDLVSIEESATDDHTNNETTVIHSNVSTSTESQQIDNENERKEVGRSTEEPSVSASSSSESTLPEDEISEKLGKTTPQPFRADET